MHKAWWGGGVGWRVVGMAPKQILCEDSGTWWEFQYAVKLYMSVQLQTKYSLVVIEVSFLGMHSIQLAEILMVLNHLWLNLSTAVTRQESLHDSVRALKTASRRYYSIIITSIVASPLGVKPWVHGIPRTVSRQYTLMSQLWTTVTGSCIKSLILRNTDTYAIWPIISTWTIIIIMRTTKNVSVLPILRVQQGGTQA